MRQPQEAQLPTSRTQAGQHHTSQLGRHGAVDRRQRNKHHPGGRERDKARDAHGIGHGVDEVGRAELGQEGGDHVGEEDEALGCGGTDEVLGGGEEDYVEDVVCEAWLGG